MTEARPTPWWLPWVVAAAGAALLFLGWPYAHGHFSNRDPLLISLARFTFVETEWIFCLTVPFIVAWMVRQQAPVLKGLPTEPSWLAIPLLVMAAFLYWAGYKVDTRYPGYAAAQLFAAACILGIGGKSWFRQLLLPWSFLFFMWPLPPLEKLLSVPLRHLTSIVTAKLLTWTGMPTERIGATLLSAADPARGMDQGALYSLGVDAPCSGINSLFTLIMLASLMAFLSFRDWKRRSILVAASIPLAVLGNIFRMMMLAWGARFWGMEFAVGKTVEGRQQDSAFHFLAGMMVFAVALGGLFLLSTRLEKRKGSKVSKPPKNEGQTGASPAAVRGGVALAAFSALLVLGCFLTPTKREMTDFGLSAKLPLSLPGFLGREEPMSKKEREVFETGVKLTRVQYFDRSNGDSYMATVVRSGPVTRSLHEPEICLPGQGWTIASSQRVEIRPSDGSASFEATMLNLFMDAKPSATERAVRRRAINIYWYQGYDVATPSYENHVLITYRDALLRNINHRWSMASFFLASPPTYLDQMDFLQELSAQERLKTFVDNYVPYIVEKHGQPGGAGLSTNP